MVSAPMKEAMAGSTCTFAARVDRQTKVARLDVHRHVRVTGTKGDDSQMRRGKVEEQVLHGRVADHDELQDVLGRDPRIGGRP